MSSVARLSDLLIYLSLLSRFLVSTYCRRCLEDLKREEHLRLVLENSEML